MMNCEGEFWVKLLKGIYFHDSDFLDAKKGRRASWGWSGLLDGRDSLTGNLFWRVGNGEKIKIWKDRWILNLPEGRLRSTNVSNEDKKRKVFELIVNKGWDVKGIEEKIQKEEKEGIFNIQLPIGEREDRVVWEGAKNGCYIVRLGYHMARHMRNNVVRRDPSCSTQRLEEVWKEIWRLKNLPKVQYFIWRAIVGALPTKEALWKRKCSKEPNCPICESGVETVEHMQLLCPWIRPVWFRSLTSLKVNCRRFDRFDLWCEEWLKEENGLNDIDKARLASTCWYIWKARCKYVFEGKKVVL